MREQCFIYSRKSEALHVVQKRRQLSLILSLTHASTSTKNCDHLFDQSGLITFISCSVNVYFDFLPFLLSSSFCFSIHLSLFVSHRLSYPPFISKGQYYLVRHFAEMLISTDLVEPLNVDVLCQYSVLLGNNTTQRFLSIKDPKYVR